MGGGAWYSSDKTRPDSPVPTLQGPCGRSPKRSRGLRASGLSSEFYLGVPAPPHRLRKGLPPIKCQVPCPPTHWWCWKVPEARAVVLHICQPISGSVAQVPSPLTSV